MFPRQFNSPPSHVTPLSTSSSIAVTSGHITTRSPQQTSTHASSSGIPSLSSNFGGLQLGNNDTGYSTRLSTTNNSFQFGVNNPTVSPQIPVRPFGSSSTLLTPAQTSGIVAAPVFGGSFRSQSQIVSAQAQMSTISPTPPLTSVLSSLTPLGSSSHGSRFNSTTSPTSLSNPNVVNGRSSRSKAISSTNNRQPFNEEECDKLRTISKILGQVHTDVSDCRRIQRGPPGAGSLSMSLSKSKSNFNKLKPEIDAILNNQNQLSFVTALKAQLNRFNEVVNEDINERGYEDGYTDRVRYLERMNYECGRLKGMIDIILEGVWISAGNPCVAKILNYNDEEEIQGIKIEDDLEAVLSNDAQYQQGDINIDFTLTSNLCSNLMNFMEKGSNTDVTFRVGSRRVCAHRIILAAQSEYFNSLLFGSMQEAEPHSEIKLQDVPLATLQLLIRYAYCGRVQMKNVSLHEVLKLLEVSDRFSFLSLKELLVKQLSSLISVNTIIPLFLYAYNLSISGLQETCLQVADKNALTIINSESLMTLPGDLLVYLLSRDTFVVQESLILDAVLRWIKQNDGYDCASLIRCVRLTEMSQQKLLDLEDENGMFQTDVIFKAIKIQLKLYWEKMEPRGRKEKMKNLFQHFDCAKIDNTVAWKNTVDQTNNYNDHQQQLIAPPAPFSTGSAVLFHGKPNLELCNAIITSQSIHNTQFGLFGSNPVNQELTAVISLIDTFLINHIRFDPYTTNGQVNDSLGFSYTIEISTDNVNWRMLLDYSKYNCYGQQILKLPIISVRYLRFKLTSVRDSSLPFTVIFKECMLKERQHNIVFRSSGIPVLKVFEKCCLIQGWDTNEYNEPVCLVKLRKPIFVKTMRLKLNGTCDPITTGDVVVYVNDDKTGAKTATNVLLNGDASKMIEVSLSDRTIVTSINIKLVNIIHPIMSSFPTGPDVKCTISELQLKSED